QSLDLLARHATVPPERWRVQREAAERRVAAYPEGQRGEPAERAATETCGGRARQRPIRVVDPWLELFDEHPSIGARTTAPGELRVDRRRVFIDAVGARVVHADHDQGSDLSLPDQRRRRVVDVPLLAEGRGGIEDVLAVLQVEHGEARHVVIVIARGQPDGDGSRRGEDPRGKVLNVYLARDRARGIAH